MSLAPSGSASLRRLRIALTAIGILAVVLFFRRRLQDPSILLLLPDGGASWIRFPDPFSYLGRPAGKEVSLFRTRITIEEPPADALLIVKAFKVAIVQLDRNTLNAPRSELGRWKEPIEIDLAPLLKRGAHEIQIAVLDDNSHACVLARCQALGLRTGVDWEASHDGNTWMPAVRVETPESSPLGNEIRTVAQAWSRHAGTWIALFLATCAWTLVRARGRLETFALTPSRIRWLLLAAWIVLGIHSFSAVPIDRGFDTSAHLDYVRSLSERVRLPLANEGWEMFQPPLYYVLAAILQKVLAVFRGAPVEIGLRILPLACGALQIEIARRVLGRALPGQERAQGIGTWIAGLLPMSLYVSQFVGNESFAGLTSAILFYLCFHALCREEDGSPYLEAVWIGLALGIALLSKMTAVLGFPLCAVALVAAALARGRKLPSAVMRVGIAWTVAAVVGGWFYVRNWIELGKPFVGNWDWKEANRIWWQDPGYRIPEHFTRFGRSLTQPVYAAVQGFWDAVYSTMWTDGTLSGSLEPRPWNLDSMLVGAWFGLPITVAIVWAMVRIVPGSAPQRRAQRFAALAVLLTFLAALELYLRVPIYSIAKASYTLGLLPCYALLAAIGLSQATDRVGTRAVVNGLLVCFGVAAYAAYFAG